MVGKENILIYGSGSIGVFLGSKLYAKGYGVTLYGRRKLKKIHDTLLIGDVLYKTPPRVYEIGENEYDIIYVATKLYDTKNAIKFIKNLKYKPKIIAFIQNGLVEEGFYEGLENYPGFVTISIFEGYRLLENQLLITKSKLGWQMENTKQGLEIFKQLKSARINCGSSSNLPKLRAEKMMLVVAISALSTIKKKTMGELIHDPKSRQIAEELLKESYDVLKEDYGLEDYNQIRKRFYETLESVSTHYSSMYQDVNLGKPTEIDFLNGLIIKLGKKKNISTPMNKKIYDEIKQLSVKK